MSIRESDILFYGGGAALLKHGAPTRRITTIGRGGEEAKEVWTRSGGGALQRTRAGLYVAAGANIPRIERLDLDADGIFETPALLSEGGSTNLIENGDIETDANGISGQAATVTRDNAWALYGSWSAKVVTTNVTSSGLVVLMRSGARTGVVAATTYTLSGFVNVPSASVGKLLYWAIDWYNGSGTYISSSATSSFALVAGVQRLVLTGTAPAGAATGDCRLRTDANTPQGVITFWVDLIQLEALGFASSPIPTSTGALGRNPDQGTVPFYAPPQAMAIYLKLIAKTYLTNSLRVLQIGKTDDSQPRLLLYGNGSGYHVAWDDASGNSRGVDTVGTPTLNAPLELLVSLSSAGVIQIAQSVNGAPLTTSAASGALALPSAWSGPTLNIAQINGGNNGFDPLIAGILVRAPNNVFPSLADFQALLPPVGAPYS